MGESKRLLMLASMMGELARQQRENDDLFAWVDGYKPIGGNEEALLIARTINVMLNKMVSLQMLYVATKLDSEIKDAPERPAPPSRSGSAPSRSTRARPTMSLRAGLDLLTSLCRKLSS